MAGYERVVAWADILDRINVFPVPDGDTGRNLVITLSPLRQTKTAPGTLAHSLLLSARGNSGNISAQFLSAVLGCDGLDSLPACCEKGRELAYRAVKEPKHGTMLSLLDVLVGSLKRYPPEEGQDWLTPIVQDLENEVRSTRAQLPELKEAGVVDAGALGMFVFLDSFLNTLEGREATLTSSAERLKNYLDLDDSWETALDERYCLDVVLQIDKEEGLDMDGIFGLDESVVAIPEGKYLKVHLHTDSQEGIRQRLESLGNIVSWVEDDLGEQTRRFSRPRRPQSLHIMTDAAGSITRDDASSLGITLLDSYINVGDTSLPETFVDSLELFSAMRKGAKVSTAQASVFERHQCYRKVMDLYSRILYICVGSFYTGNYQVAAEWKRGNDPHGRLMILDSGSASGRLGLAVLAAAQLSLSTNDPQEVMDFASKAVAECQEIVFLDKLQYLAAGGRMSNTGAFFGDVLHLKPVISPFPDGVKKMGVVRREKDQLAFSRRFLQDWLSGEKKALVMLEYTDNQEWVMERVKPELEKCVPNIEFLLRPMSLTSATHMGPGTWGVAFLPVRDKEVWGALTIDG